jgi:hypothetical protein
MFVSSPTGLYCRVVAIAYWRGSAKPSMNHEQPLLGFLFLSAFLMIWIFISALV